jgi:hypothetical protein
LTGGAGCWVNQRTTISVQARNMPPILSPSTPFPIAIPVPDSRPYGVNFIVAARALKSGSLRR